MPLKFEIHKNNTDTQFQKCEAQFTVQKCLSSLLDYAAVGISKYANHLAVNIVP